MERARGDEWSGRTAGRERTTNGQDYTTAFSVDQSPEHVFDAIDNVQGWWEGEIEGSTDRVGGVFTYRYGDITSPNRR